MDDKKTILVIDDEADLVKVLKFRLEKRGYNVLTAFDGEQGLAMAEKARPHLIILDINMPRMSGIEFYKRICGAGERPPYPVLVLTARGELKDLFKDINADGFLSKPFEIDVLYNEVDIILERRYGKPKARKGVESGAPKKVLIVDDNPDTFGKIALFFLNAGYIVHAANSGKAVIEKINADMPDLLIIKLGLSDLPGDVVVLKLRQMPKTMKLPVVMFAPEMTEAEQKIESLMRSKLDINKIVESAYPHEILKEAEKILYN